MMQIFGSGPQNELKRLTKEQRKQLADQSLPDSPRSASPVSSRSATADCDIYSSVSEVSFGLSCCTSV